MREPFEETFHWIQIRRSERPKNRRIQGYPPICVVKYYFCIYSIRLVRQQERVRFDLDFETYNMKFHEKLKTFNPYTLSSRKDTRTKVTSISQQQTYTRQQQCTKTKNSSFLECHTYKIHDNFSFISNIILFLRLQSILIFDGNNVLITKKDYIVFSKINFVRCSSFKNIYM